jgi:hypothetical protein
MFSFGASRSSYDRVYYKERIPHDRTLPGPGAYKLGSTLGKNSKSFSLLAKIPAESAIKVSSKTPGPGTYGDANKLASNGRYPTSNTKNIKGIPSYRTPS